MLMCSSLYAVPNFGEYSGFKLTKELWVCSSVAFPIDISYDAFNVDFKTVMKGGYGYFVQVKPGQHKDGTQLPSSFATIANPTGGVFNVVGKPAGVYEFIFISTDNNFCGMSNGEQAVVRVYIVPQPTGFPILTNVCPGEAVDVDFDKFIPSEISYFLKEMGWTVSYKDKAGAAVTMPVKANLSNVGNNVYEYSINDTSGPYAGKYTSMKASVYACPEDSAFLNHTVRIREGAYAIPDKELTYCMQSLLSVSETAEILSINLFSQTGASAMGGKWSLIKHDNIAASEFLLNETTGDASIPIGLIDFRAGHANYEVVYKYAYNDCSGNDTATNLKLIFSYDFKTLMVEKEKEVCRNLVSGMIDLSSTFGFNVPLTSGIWYEKVGTDFKEMLYGAVDISDKSSGSLYTYKYDVSPAIDSLCLVDGLSTLMHLRVRDAEVLNFAEVQICKPQFAAGVVVDLFQFVPGLNDPSRFDPTKVTWRGPDGSVISNPSSYQLLAIGQEAADTSNTQFLFQFDFATECGVSKGNLYISAVDSLTSNIHRVVNVCFTDDYAHHIDLRQVLGIAGLKGKFILDSTTPPGKDLTLSYNQNTGVLDANKAFDTANQKEEYTFVYFPDGTEECVPSNMKITVRVTKELE